MTTKLDHVFLTGATGALGREILSWILEGMSPAHVTVLVRGRDEGEVRRRLDDLVRYVGEWRPELDFSRVSAVRGDITQPVLGLHPAIRGELTRSVTHVVHSAATIQLTVPLSRARSINLGGTRELLRFAEGCPNLVRLAHVSTAYVAGDRSGVITEEELDCGQGFLNAYERSKFEAESLVRKRMPILPVAVIRPSIVLGDSRDGHAATLATIFPVLRHVASGRLRTLPGRGSTPLDLVPVDYVAAAILRVLCTPGSEGGTFHVTAGGRRSMTVRQLCELAICEVGRHPERELRFTGERRPQPEPSGDPLCEDLRCFFEYLSGAKDFDDSHFRRLVGSGVPPCPDPRVYLPRVLSYAWSAPAMAPAEHAGAGSWASVSAPGVLP